MLKEAKIQENLRYTEHVFRTSCTQIVMLNERLESMSRRYRIAKHQERKSFRYSLRLRLAVVEALRNIYYDYAKIKAERAKRLSQIIKEIRDKDNGASTESMQVTDAETSVSGNEAHIDESEAASDVWS